MEQLTNVIHKKKSVQLLREKIIEISRIII